MSGWLRYVDRVTSSMQPVWWKPCLWFSLARLSAPLTGIETKESSDQWSLSPWVGAGWSRSKDESQTKAVTEAVERWAYGFFRKDASQTALDLDGSSSGFAAAPRQLGSDFAKANSLAESLERWVLHRLDRGDRMAFEILDPSKFDIPRSLFGGGLSQLSLFTHRVLSRGCGHHFALVIKHLPGGGILPGSACGRDKNRAIERASIECFNHERKITRILTGKENIPPRLLVQRLWHFAFDVKSANRIKECLNAAQGERESVEPAIGFQKEIHGPWSDDFHVWRTLIQGAEPLVSGGVERFVI